MPEIKDSTRPEAVVTIRAVGVKDRNRLRIAGRELQL